MHFSDTGIVVGCSLVLLVVALVLLYIKFGGRRKSDQYDWKPAQDYDVVQTGEANMTPAFPVLKKRKSVKTNDKTGDHEADQP
ncbi:hypothetical protein [Ahrensia sp. R2A130]|uniref:hypothetical protein n=1 Tax=Ahrensia sp. R2A130 TaxID=744979 RepID=UPI0001E0B463|nr:hypothetical protein [Ahrensia sp. R2A130]EFL90144.1 hypothetical protein R2A130_0213 [Ahrensia sp. R2A130]